jgi:hypothetical protein
LASSVEWHQGDQIGRIFALWVIISRGNFFWHNNPKYLICWFPRKKLCIQFGKNWLGYILGDIIKNSSGHPEWHACIGGRATATVATTCILCCKRLQVKQSSIAQANKTVNKTFLFTVCKLCWKKWRQGSTPMANP